jgi:hypothetical protein
MKQKLFQAIAIAYGIVLFTSIGYAQEGGYLSGLSVAKGERLSFYFSTSVFLFPCRFSGLDR